MMHTITELSHLGLIHISGSGAKQFLQGQLTCNLEEVTSTQSRMGAHCNPQGRIISLFRLFFYHNSYYMQMPCKLVPLAIKALQKYAVFFKVTLTDASDELKQLGYRGNTLIQLPHIVDEQLTTDKCIIIKLPGTTPRYQLIGNPVIPHPMKPGAVNDWKAIDIATKISAIYPETSEKFLPHEIDLPTLNAVSFNKGCYTGQEIIARMQYRGKQKSRLYRARVVTEAPLLRGNDIYITDQCCGSIVDYAQIDYNRYELLVIAQLTDAKTASLFIDPEKRYSLEIIE